MLRTKISFLIVIAIIVSISVSVILTLKDDKRDIRYYLDENINKTTEINESEGALIVHINKQLNKSDDRSNIEGQEESGERLDNPVSIPTTVTFFPKTSTMNLVENESSQKK